MAGALLDVVVEEAMNELGIEKGLRAPKEVQLRMPKLAFRV